MPLSSNANQQSFETKKEQQVAQTDQTELVTQNERTQQLTDNQAGSSEIANAIDPTIRTGVTKSRTILAERENAEIISLNNSFAILQHKTNYILPITHVSNPSSRTNQDLTPTNVDKFEAKYQLSVKMPLYINNHNANGFYFGFTAISFWQVYNSDVSKPFRETNYEPEIFYSFQKDVEFAFGNLSEIQLGISHQSNGQSGLSSRSWNRVYSQFIVSNDDYFGALKIWARLPEDDKKSPNDSNGDDNPDIDDYLGNFELFLGTQINQYTIYGKIRNNLDFSDNKGSVELNLSYQFSDRYSLLLQYHNGYGDSLIDYNRYQQRFGIGIQLNFL